MKKKAIIISISAIVIIGGIVAGVFALKPSTDTEQPETIESTVEPTTEPTTEPTIEPTIEPTPEVDTTIEDENASDITTESNGGSISTEYETAPSVVTETEAPSTQTEQTKPSNQQERPVVNPDAPAGSQASTATPEQIQQAIAVLREQGYSEAEINEILYGVEEDIAVGKDTTDDYSQREYTDEELEALKGAAGMTTH